MSDAKLGILLSADTTQAQQGLNSFNQTVGKVTGGLSVMKGGVAVLETQLIRLQKIAQQDLSFRQLERVNGLIKSTQSQLSSFNGFNKVASSANSANLALINTGRVIQDLPFGFLGIANNLNPLLESFQRLKVQTGSSGTAFKELLKSLGGAGGVGFALSLVSSALIVFGDALFGNKAKAEQDKAALEALGTAIDSVKKSTEGLTSALQFQNQLGSINIKIFGLGDIQDLREQSIAQLQLIDSLGSKVSDAQKNLSKARELDQKKSTDKTKELLQSAETSLEDAFKNEADAREKSRLIFRQIQLQKNEDQKKLNDDAKKDYEKYITDTISRARKFADEFGSAFVVPDLEDKFFTTRKQLLERSLKLLSDVSGGDLKIKIPVQPELDPISTALPSGLSFEQMFPEAKNFKLNIPAKFDFSLQEALNVEELRNKFKQFGQQAFIGLQTGLNAKQLTDLFDQINKNFKNAADIAGLLTPVIDGVIQALGSGKNAFAAFAAGIKQALQGVIAKLLETAAAAAILSIVTGGTSNAAKGGLSFIQAFKSIFGGFRAGGGPVSAGTPYVVGEIGREVFVPSVSGKIIPNNQLSGLSGSVKQEYSERLIAQVSGANIDLVLQRFAKYKGNNV